MNLRHKLYQFYLHHKPSILAISTITLVWLTIIVTNYTPGTFLTGWDNVQVELDFGLNIKRAIFAVWQEFQGVGLVGGHAHAADLPRILFMFLTSIVLPISTVRYFYMFLMLLIGPIGAYFLLKKVVLKKRTMKATFYAALVGALFYLLNLGTVQNFYVSLSAFATFYGFLPWLIYILIELLEKFDRKRFAWFVILNVLSAPFAFIPQIFIAYTGVFAIIALSKLIEARDKRKAIIRITISVVLLFVVHSYWILPFAYFTANNLSVRYQSTFNTILSEKFFLQNKNYGSIKDVPILRGGYFESTDYDHTNDQVSKLIFQPWINHLNHTSILVLGYTLFSIVLLGVLVSIKKKEKWWLGFLGVFLLGYFMLSNDNLPFGFIFSFLRDHINLFKEAFRFPYNKFSVVAITGYTIFFAYGTDWLLEQITKRIKHKKVLVLQLSSIMTVAALVVFTLPIWNGHLFYNQIEQNIPQQYFDLFEFMHKQDPNTRIANFPQYTLYGWNYYNWGYHGSGFLWYGLEQPIMDRNFDVWHPKNEAYYSEISQALYSKNAKHFKDVLNKYQITWILLDQSIIAPNRDEVLFHQELLDIINSFKHDGLILEQHQFGDIYLYKFKLQDAISDYVFAPKSVTKVINSSTHTSRDLIYEKYGTYIDTPGTNTIAPFASMQDNSVAIRYAEDIKNINFQQPQNIKYLSFSSNVQTKNNSTVEIPNGNELLANLPFDVYVDKTDNGSVRFQFIIYLPSLTADKKLVWGGTRIISKSLNIPSSQGLTVVVDGSLVLNVEGSQITSAKKYIGSGQFGNHKTHTIRIYSRQAKESAKIDTSSFSKLTNCADKEFDDTVTYSSNKSSITFTGANASPCVYASTGIKLSKDQLLKTEVAYSSKTSTIPFICTALEGDPSCINNPRQYQTDGTNTNLKYWQNYHEHTQPTEGEIWITASLDAYYKDLVQTITYSDFTVSTYNKLAETTITDSEIAQKAQLTDSVYIPEQFRTLSFLLPVLGKNNQYVYTKNKLIDGTHPRNCSTNSIGQTSVKLINDQLVYQSDNSAIACNTYELANLNQNSAYMFIIGSNNLSGLPISICLYNYDTTHCDIETRLSASNNTVYQYLLVPPMVKDSYGYSLNLSSESVGDIKTINNLNTIVVRSIPYSQIKQIYIHTNSSDTTETIANGITQIRTSKSTPFFYKVEYTSKADNSYLALSQSFERGWTILGTKNTHFKINNWANAWSVEQGEHTIFIIFTPQILEFVGFLLLSSLLPIYLLIRHTL